MLCCWTSELGVDEPAAENFVGQHWFWCLGTKEIQQEGDDKRGFPRNLSADQRNRTATVRTFFGEPKAASVASGGMIRMF